jgi:hypothetical protein
VSGSGDLKVTMEWGGSEGTKTEVEVKAEVHNDRGDHLGVTYTRDDDGSSHSTVEGGSSSKEDK